MRGVCVAKRPPRHHPLALDLMGLSGPDGRTSTAGQLHWLLGGVDSGRYHGWGRSVYGPEQGTVVAASDGLHDRLKTGAVNTAALWVYATFLFRPPTTDEGHPDIRPNVGNHVMVDLGNGRVAFYAHLQNGSIAVEVDDTVNENTVFGMVGNSGNTTAPHLHVHVLDQMHDLASARLMPWVFAEYDRWDGAGWIRESETTPEAGEVLRSVQT